MSLSAYDEIAGMYDSHWNDWYLPEALGALEKLFFSGLEPPAQVLDLCCGSGHVTKEIVARGYRVTGVDNSAALIELARKRLPDVAFEVQDARELSLEQRFDACISTFDSLNHILTLPALRRVFSKVRKCLVPGGLFVFDMNLEQAYTADLHDWTVDVRGSSVGLVRGSFDPVTRRAATELLWFARTNKHCWHLRRSIVEEQCYPEEDILRALAAAGFEKIDTIGALEAGASQEIGFGRIFVSARKNAR